MKSKSIIVKEKITDVIHFKYSKIFPSKIREIATWHNLCYNMKMYNVFELITSRSITINRCCLSFCWKVFHTKMMVILDMSKSAVISRLETWKLLPNILYVHSSPLYKIGCKDVTTYFFLLNLSSNIFLFNSRKFWSNKSLVRKNIIHIYMKT